LALPSKQTSLIFRHLRVEMPSSQTLSHDQKLKSARGFTIIEVALAATVLALTLVGMIGVIESGAATLDLSRKQTIAGQILHEEIDNLHMQSWATVTAYPTGVGGTTTLAISSVWPPSGGPPANTVYDPILETFWQQLAGNTSFQYQNPGSYQDPTHAPYFQFPFPFTVTRTVIPITSNLLQVTFAIQWTGLTGHSYTRRSTTYVTQYGLNLSYQRS